MFLEVLFCFSFNQVYEDHIFSLNFHGTTVILSYSFGFSVIRITVGDAFHLIINVEFVGIIYSGGPLDCCFVVALHKDSTWAKKPNIPVVYRLAYSYHKIISNIEMHVKI